MGIIFWISMAIGGIGLIIEIIDYDYGKPTITALSIGILVFLLSHFILVMNYDIDYTYLTKPAEFQQIEGEYFIPQGNEYVVKIDGEIKIYPKSMFYTVQSDSVYNEIQYKCTKINKEKFEKWMVGEQKNESTRSIDKFILHRNLN